MKKGGMLALITIAGNFVRYASHNFLAFSENFNAPIELVTIQGN